MSKIDKEVSVSKLLATTKGNITKTKNQLEKIQAEKEAYAKLLKKEDELKAKLVEYLSLEKEQEQQLSKEKAAETKENPVKTATKTSSPKDKVKKEGNKEAKKKVVKEDVKKVGGIDTEKGSSKKLVNLDEKALQGEYMDDAMIEYFYNKLLNDKQALMEKVENTITHMRDDILNFPDPIDRASQEEETILELRYRDRDRQLVHKIESSLSLIKTHKDEYGFCKECGEEIGLQRMLARPTAELCFECKDINEKQEKHKI